MAKRLYANNARAHLGVAIVTTGTLPTITVEAGKGGLFPSPSGGDWFDLTIEDAAKNCEIFKIVGRSGDVLTVGSSGNDRAQQSTTARTFDTTAICGLRVTRLLLEDFTNHLVATSGAHAASAISFTAAGGLAASTVQAALEELDSEKFAKTGGNISGAVTIQSGGLVVTAGGVTVSAGGATITGNSTITGTLGVSAGLTVTTGGALISSGGLSVSAGGATITGNVAVTGTVNSTGTISTNTGNIVAAAGFLQAISGTPTQGIVYLGNSGARYVGYDGSNYVMPGGELFVNSRQVITDAASSTLNVGVSGRIVTYNLPNVVTPGNYGDPVSTSGKYICAITIDAYGRVTGLTEAFNGVLT